MSATVERRLVDASKIPWGEGLCNIKDSETRGPNLRFNCFVLLYSSVSDEFSRDVPTDHLSAASTGINIAFNLATGSHSPS